MIRKWPRREIQRVLSKIVDTVPSSNSLYDHRMMEMYSAMSTPHPLGPTRRSLAAGDRMSILLAMQERDGSRPNHDDLVRCGLI